MPVEQKLLQISSKYFFLSEKTSEILFLTFPKKTLFAEMSSTVIYYFILMAIMSSTPSQIEA